MKDYAKIRRLALADYMNGERLCEIASKYAIDKGTICRWRRKAGIAGKSHIALVWEKKRANGEHHHSFGLRRKPVTLKKPSVGDLSYIAGFFDGEGTLGVRDDGDTSNLFVSMVNTDRRPLDFIVERLGGRIYGPRLRKNALGTKPLYQWSLTSINDIDFFLKCVEPLMKCKGDAARKLLAWISERDSVRKGILETPRRIR